MVVPTYNESANISQLIDAILVTDPRIDVLVVDDDSPDFTGELAETVAARSPRVMVMRRSGPRGRGLSGIEGFQWALAKGYEAILEMDADFSHLPEFIPVLLDELKDYDVVIGSRQVKGARVIGQSSLRRGLSHCANIYIRAVLGLKVQDCTSGFRGFRGEVLASLGLERMKSAGPSIVEEILYACAKRGYRMKEIPITFMNRRAGKSKLSFLELFNMIFMILRIRF